MANEEIITQLNLTKQRINEGSKIVRDQIDNNVLPIIGTDQQAVSDKIYQARRLYMEGDHAAKIAINEAIDMLSEPSGPHHTIPEQFTYPVCGQWIAPFFVPAIFCCNQISRTDLDWFADRMAMNIHGNVIRGFSFGAWEAYWKNWRIVPWIQRVDGLFDLDQYNPAYWEELYWRIEAFTKRNIFVFIDLVDNCSLHDHTNSHWGIHPWNGKNNVNGTSDWWPMIYHYYEDEHSSKPGAAETEYYVEKFYRDFVDRTYSRFKGMIGYGAGNEVLARTLWHQIQKRIIEEKAPDLPRESLITSMDDSGFYAVDIWHDWIYSVHGGCKETNQKEFSEAAYLNQRALVPDKQWHGIKARNFIVSQDGCFPTKTLDEAEAITGKILSDGCRGIEQHLRPLLVKENNVWESLAKKPEKIDWTLRTLIFSYAEAVKKAWFNYNGWPIN